MSSVPPQARCHSVGAGYTLCLFVIPSDSTGAWGQTCNPERSLHRKALRTQKTHKLLFRFCLSLFLPTHPSLSSPLPLCVPLCCASIKWPMVQNFSVHWPVFRSLPTVFVYQQHNVTPLTLLLWPDKSLYLVLLWAKFSTLGNYMFLGGICSFAEILGNMMLKTQNKTTETFEPIFFVNVFFLIQWSSQHEKLNIILNNTVVLWLCHN